MTGNQHTPEPAEQAIPPTMLVVASDPKLLKLLHMALSLEFGCSVRTVKSARSAQEAAQRSRPALLILDEEFLNDRTADPDARLHRIAGLEQLPTLFLNATDLSQLNRQGYPTRFLAPSWKVEALYAVVRELLGQTP
jgi:response regulator RpfG family c-di-GMP phosphodiesterase